MMIFQVIGNQKKVGITTVISDKVDFKSKKYNETKRSLYYDKGISISRGYVLSYSVVSNSL